MARRAAADEHQRSSLPATVIEAAPRSRGMSHAGTREPAPRGSGNRAGIGYADPRSNTAPARPAQLVGRDDLLRDRRRGRHIERVHRLGPRVTAELLDEIARHHGIGDDIDRRLARYARLDPAILAGIAGDRFPPPPTWVVPR